MQRKDDFEKRREKLASLSDQELKDYFWQLAQYVVAPMMDLAKTHTSPSIERSVLLRMGFSSIQAKDIVMQCVEKGFLGKGAGHSVWRLAQLNHISYQEAGACLARGEGWDQLREHWERRTQHGT
jgi:D-ornithine 4,5-aminomutase subunit alpha